MRRATASFSIPPSGAGHGRSPSAQPAAEFGPRLTSLHPVTTRSSPHVTKTLLASADGGRIESVLLRYAAGWSSLCLSSQVGCGLGCTFCATGTIGLRRQLTADEICDQVLLAARRPDSIAFMGMGEPLANPHTAGHADALGADIDAACGQLAAGYRSG